MGNAGSFGTGTERVQSPFDRFDIDFRDTFQQCKAFQESIEHQTNASLSIIDSQDDLMKKLTGSHKLSHETNREDLAWDQVAKNQVIFKEQVLAIQKAGESFKHLVQSLYERIYPLTYNIQNVRRESQSQMYPNSSSKDDRISQRRSDVTANALDEIRRLKDNLRGKEKLISELKAHLDKQSHLLSNITREVEDLKQEKHALTRDSTELKEHVKSLKRINEHFEKDNKTFVSKINTHKEDIKGLRYDNDTLRRRIRDLEQENRGLYSQTESIRKQLDLQRKQKFQVHVQMFSPRKGDMASMVLQEMIDMLKTQFGLENRDLVASICTGSADIKPDIATLILCINASRLGSDVESALTGLSATKHQGLIILHHKDTHALPNQPSERLLTSSSSEYKKLGGIFDMAFLSGKGIYPCDMNNRAVNDLVTFIKTDPTTD